MPIPRSPNRRKSATPATASANREWPANLGGRVFSPDTRLFAAAYAGAVYFFDVETGKEIRKLPLKTGSGPFAISPDGKSLAAVATVAAGPPRQISLMLVDIASEKRPGNGRSPKPRSRESPICFSANGKHILFEGGQFSALVPGIVPKFDGRLQVLDAATGEVLRTIKSPSGMGWFDSRCSPQTASSWPVPAAWTCSSGMSSRRPVERRLCFSITTENLGWRGIRRTVLC